MMINTVCRREIRAIARSEVDPHLGDLTADGFPVAKVPGFGEAKACSNACLRPYISKAVQPIPKLFGLEDGEHGAIVSTRIRPSSNPLAWGRRPTQS